MSKQSAFSNDEYRKIYSGIWTLDGGHFGEDPELFGDSIQDVMTDMLRFAKPAAKAVAAADLTRLIANDDPELERATWALISFDPTADIEDECPGWGFYPSLRAFWTDVLHHLQADLAKPTRDDDY